jgi:hypothetical protein
VKFLPSLVIFPIKGWEKANFSCHLNEKHKLLSDGSSEKSQNFDHSYHWKQHSHEKSSIFRLSIFLVFSWVKSFISQ